MVLFIGTFFLFPLTLSTLLYLFSLFLKQSHQSHGPVESISSWLLFHTSTLSIHSITLSSTSVGTWSIFICLTASRSRLFYYFFGLVSRFPHHLVSFLTSTMNLYLLCISLFLVRCNIYHIRAQLHLIGSFYCNRSTSSSTASSLPPRQSHYIIIFIPLPRPRSPFFPLLPLPSTSVSFHLEEALSVS